MYNLSRLIMIVMIFSIKTHSNSFSYCILVVIKLYSKIILVFIIFVPIDIFTAIFVCFGTFSINDISVHLLFLRLKIKCLVINQKFTNMKHKPKIILYIRRALEWSVTIRTTTNFIAYRH